MVNLNSDVKLYVITHTPCTFLEGEAILPMAINTPIGEIMGIIASDTLDNVGHLNHQLAEYSTFYWAWKNDISSQFISFFHFRRYLILKENPQIINNVYDYGWDNATVKALFNDYDIILPKPMVFGTSVYDQYCGCHEQRLIDKFMEVINRKYPWVAQSFNNALQGNTGYYCNLFIMRKSDFNNYMTFAFDIFEEMKEDLAASYQGKPFAYLGERLFTCYVEYLKTVEHFRFKEVDTLYL